MLGEMHIICSSVCATAFYAADKVALGSRHLDTFRTAVADA